MFNNTVRSVAGMAPHAPVSKNPNNEQIIKSKMDAKNIARLFI
jgi:hypothetical protein